MKKLLFLLMTMVFAGFLSQAQQTITIGTGTSSTYEPITGFYGKHRTVSIYTSADGLVAGAITSLQWNRSSGTAYVIPTKIYLKEDTTNQLAATTDLIWDSLISGATLVYDASPTIPAAAGWVRFNLTTPFLYSGTKNLMVLVASNVGGTGSRSINYYYTASGTNNNAYIRRDSSSTNTGMNDSISFSANGSTTSARNNQRPNIKIGIENPNCISPETPTASLITPTDATLNWTPRGSQNQWTIYYKDAAATAWTSQSVNSTTFSFANTLTPQTTYNVYIKADCGADTSYPSQILIFTTACGYPTLPLYEGFESTGTSNPSAPNCWSYLKTGTSTMYGSTTYAHTGSKGYHFNITPSASNEAMLVSPLLTDDIRTVRLKFWMRYSSTSGCELKVGYMSNPTDATTFNEVASFTAPTTWTEFTVPFDTVTGTGQHIAISANKAGTASVNYIYIDDILIEPIPPCSDVNNLTAVSSTTSSIDIKYSSTATNFEVSYREAIDTSAGWTTLSISDTATTISGLSPSTAYQIKVRSSCSGGDGLWSSIITFLTRQIPAILPLNEDFDDLSNFNWTITNGSQINKWYVGSLVHTGSTGNGIYISDDLGQTYKYTTGTTSVTHFYRDVTFDPFLEYKLSFDWKAGGESIYDYIRINILDTTASQEPVAGTLITTGIAASMINLDTNWKKTTIILPDTLSSKTKRVVFTWRNDNSSGIQPPAAIDNIELVGSNCVTPKNITATYAPTPTAQEILVKWNNVSGGGNFVVEYRSTNSPTGTWTTQAIGADTTAILTALDTSTRYEIRIGNDCGTETSYSAYAYSTTLNTLPAAVPFVDDFEGSTLGWVLVNGTSSNNQNKWYWGTAASASGTHSMYISDTNGILNRYNINDVSAGSTVHFYKDIAFPAGTTNFLLSFDWRGMGEKNSAGDNYDYLRVSLVDLTTTPTAGTEITTVSNILFNQLNWRKDWSNASIILPESLAGTTKRLVFSWKNNVANDGEQPAGAIDNIEVKTTNCTIPTNVKALYTPEASSLDVNLTWTGVANGDYIVEYRKTGIGTSWVSQSVATNTNYTITGLDTNTVYEIRVGNNCSGDIVYTSSILVQTYYYPLSTSSTEDFEGTTAQMWAAENGPKQGSYEQKNRWFVGAATGTGTGTHSAYISDDQGVTNHYANKAGVSHIFRDITFAPLSSSSDYVLSFDWKSNGDASDYLQVSLVNSSTLPQWGKAADAASVVINKLNLGNNWGTATVTLPDTLSGKTKRLVFSWINDGTVGAQTPAAIDNISFSLSPCGKPSGLTASTIIDTTVNLSWISLGTNFNVQYRIVGDPAWQTETSTSTNHTIGNTIPLSPNTNYEARIQTQCGAGVGDTSNWSNTIQFRTACGLPVLPLLEGFESTTTSSPSIPNCWSYIKTISGSSMNASTTYAHSGSKSYLFSHTPSATNEAMLISPVLREPVNTLRLKFWMRYSSTSGCGIKVGYISDPLDATTFKEVASFTPPTTWTEFIVKFDTITGTGQYIAISANKAGTASGNYLYIDDITIEPIPACGDIQYVLVNTIDTNSATIHWNLVAPVASYDVQYKIAGSSTWSSSISVSGSDTSHVLTPLQPSTAYEVRVRAMCSVTDSGAWSIPATFATLCVPTALPIVENFDNTVVGTAAAPNAPLCWDYTKNNSAAEAYVTNGLPSSSPNCYRLYYASSSTSGKTALLSPTFRDNLNTVRARFKVATGGTAAYSLKVGYLTDPSDISTFVTYKTLSVMPSWTNYTVNFDTASFISNMNRIAFVHGESGTGQSIRLDDINIELIPACSDVENVLSTTATNATSITLSFTTIGSPTSFNVNYREVGTTTWQSTTFNTSPGTITGLTSLTTYEIRLQSNCGSGLGAWSDVVTVTTTQVPVTIPFTEDFENNPDWVFVNGTQPSKWVVGTAAHNGGSKGLYVSTDNGVTNTYDNNTYVYAAKTITFNTAGDYRVQYDWKCNGESSGTNYYDYLKVLLAPGRVTFTAGSDPNETSCIKLYGSKPLMHQTTWQRKDTIVTVSQAGSYNLVFYWRADVSTVNNPPAAIDNISVTATSVTCNTVTTVTTTATGTSVKVDWTAPAGQTQWKVSALQAGNPVASQIVNTRTYTFPSLTRGATYTFEVRNICGANDTSTAVASTSVSIRNCENVTNVTLERACPTTAVVSWTAPAGQTQWQLWYQPQAGGAAITKEVTAKKDTLIGLTANTAYDLKVRPICGTGDTGEYTTPITVQTNSCDTVEYVLAPRTDNNDSVFVSWYNNGCHQNWQISVVPKGNSANPDNVVTTNTYQGTYIKLENPSQEYDVYVRGNCGNGLYSPWNTTLGIHDAKIPLIKVILAPNPARENTKLSINGITGNVEMVLMTVDGKVINKENILCTSELKKDISLKGLAKGTYLIRLTHKDWTKVERLIVQ